MKWMLSHIILLALLVDSPVFAITPEIPSHVFSPSSSLLYRNQETSNIVIVRRFEQLAELDVAVYHPETSSISFPIFSVIDCFPEIENGKASPVISFV